MRKELFKNVTSKLLKKKKKWFHLPLLFKIQLIKSFSECPKRKKMMFDIISMCYFFTGPFPKNRLFVRERHT